MGAKHFGLVGATTIALVATRASLGAEINIPTSAASLTGPFILTNGCIMQTFQTDANNGGRAEFEFTVATPGRYVLQAVVDAPGEAVDALFVNVDGEPQSPAMLWEIPSSRGFVTNYVCTAGNELKQNRIFRLAAGRHQLIIRGGKGNVRLAHLAFLPAPAAPVNVRIVGGGGP